MISYSSNNYLYGQQYHSESTYSTTAANFSSPPPSLHDLNRWFDYYDLDRSGALNREELVNALVHTYQSNDPQSIRETVYSIFPAFDSDRSGSIDRHEFLRSGGLGESLLSTMQYQERLTPPYASYYPNAAVSATSSLHQVQQQQYQTMKVAVPPGMGTGQQILVQTTNGLFKVTIPDRSIWVNSAFEFKIPAVMNTTAATAVATPMAAPVAADNSYHPSMYLQQSHQTDYAYLGEQRMQQQQSQWISFMQFRGGEEYYQPPPLQIIRISLSLSAVQVSGRRRALLIGINYPGSPAELRGCVNDAKNMQNVLLRHGYPNDSSHMVVLTDDNHDRNYMPTANNIFKAMQWLVQGVTAGDLLFFHYSGHGSQVEDQTGMELDGMNETIVPSDYNKRMIIDDELWGSIVYPLPNGVRLTALMDCCHSGTGLDLPYEYSIKSKEKHQSKPSFNLFVDGKWLIEPNPAHSQGDVVLFSGCEDSQTSVDIVDKYQAGGAMTQSFISAYEENPSATYAELLARIHKALRLRGFPQRPQMTTSQTFDVHDRRFSFTEGIECNGNELVGRNKTRHIKQERKGKKSEQIIGALNAAVGVASVISSFSQLFSPAA